MPNTPARSSLRPPMSSGATGTVSRSNKQSCSKPNKTGRFPVFVHLSLVLSKPKSQWEYSMVPRGSHIFIYLLWHVSNCFYLTAESRPPTQPVQQSYIQPVTNSLVIPLRHQVSYWPSYLSRSKIESSKMYFSTLVSLFVCNSSQGVKESVQK